MIETQKIYLGEHPIEVTKFGAHGNLIKQPETLITKGLLNYYDAENPGGTPSTTWTDLMGNQDGSVNADVSHTSGTPSYYDFPATGTGTDADTIIFYTGQPFSGSVGINHTICAWVDFDQSKDNIISMVGEDVAPNGSKLTFRTQSDGLGANNLRVETRGANYVSSTLGALSTNNWYMCSYKLDGNNQTDITMYLNATKDDGVTGSNNLSLKTTRLQTGNQSPSTVGQKLDGQMGVFLIYNRALEDWEIEHNFNYFKSRYGY
jgi:hypothetical protein